MSSSQRVIGLGQFKDILRGCFATYVAGTLLLFVAELPSAIFGDATFGLGETLVILMVYGAMLAFLLTLIVLFVWLILAFIQAEVVFPVAPAVAIALISLPMIAEVGLGAGLLLGVFFGGLAGTHFWYWAFGRVWQVEMGFSPAKAIEEES